jgi:hypothetical protein
MRAFLRLGKMLLFRHSVRFRPQAVLRSWWRTTNRKLLKLEMNRQFYFSFAPDWQFAHGAYWVHHPVLDLPGAFVPPAPIEVPHKGYAILHVEFESYELVFSSRAQVDHYIEILSKKLLPTTRQLSAVRATGAGPNQHWLSRLPCAIKAPKKRSQLVSTLLAAREFAATSAPSNSFNG